MAALSLKNYSIAVIEDNHSIRDMYLAKLELSGFTVHGADNGRKGLELVEKVKPDLLLLDLMMPEMGGEEMLRRVRENIWSANMRAIILTNVSRDEAPHSLRFLSVDRYVVKAHHTPAQVLEIVKEVLHIDA